MSPWTGTYGPPTDHAVNDQKLSIFFKKTVYTERNDVYDRNDENINHILSAMLILDKLIQL